MDFTFCQFSQIYILKSGNAVPNNFISTPGEMNMGVENQAVYFLIDFSQVRCSLVLLF